MHGRIFESLYKFVILRSGYPFKSSEWTQAGVPVLKIANIKDGRVILDGCGFVSPEKAETIPEWYTRENDVLIAMTGYVGEVALIKPNERYLINQRVGRFEFIEDSVIEKKFFFYFLRLKQTRQYLENVARGSAQANLSSQDIADMKIPIPPLPEQRRIAHILGTLDDKIENNRKTAKTLEAMAQAIFQSWFVNFDPVRAKMAGESRESICRRLKLTPEILDLFPDRLVDSELGKIPEGWEVKPFLDVCDLKGGAQPPASTFINKPMDGYTRLIQIRDFSSDSHPTYVKESPRLKRVTEDDILIGRYGSASGNKDSDSLGRVCRGLAGAYNVALMKLSPILVGSEFAYQLVSSKFFYDYLQGVSCKAVQAGFSKSELTGLLTVVPPEAISGSYEKLSKIIWTEKKSIDKAISRLSAIRDALLPKLMSGEIRVPDIESSLQCTTG